MAIFYSFVIIAALGLLLGAGLSFADKKLHVEKDEKLMKLEEIMPGANCGGCGFAGCSAYAEAVFKGEAEPGLCSPGGAALAEQMGKIMGKSVELKERQVAFVFCNGSKEATLGDYDYEGITDCRAAQLLLGGPKQCKTGCLGFGTCMSVCPVEAITRDEKGRIVVEKDKCIGCGKCTKVCPNGVIRLVPEHIEYLTACNNHDAGGVARKICETSCIGCQMCARKVEGSPFEIEAFLAHNNYEKDQSNAAAACEICPRKCIVKR